MSDHPRRTAKTDQLDAHRHRNTGEALTSDTGTKIADDQRSLRAGRRGPMLLQDTRFYRKQSQFSRERIPEKVVHARGFGVHGSFELHTSLSEVTCAHFLSEPGTVTPVFVRFSNFIGSRGSKDTAIDVRGFATKFYTREGNYDSLALSFGVFIVQDPMKFADFVHSIKPDPATDVPQAASAHDTFWDYVACNQESAHMVMWLMSMRGRPRSWRMMEAWPINTMRLVDAEGRSTFARFVWKPELGVHSLLLDEANVLGGVDPDYHRNDLIEAIESGAYPRYELGVQLIAEEDEHAYDFDILDDTKFWPEEQIPVRTVGTMTLDRLTDDFFAEEEQSSFDPSTLVPGIAMTDDPVLQGRSFAYRDTDYHRLGTANLNHIPINQPITGVHDNARDGFVRHRIDTDTVDYGRNALADDTPAETPAAEGGYAEPATPVAGHVTREVQSAGFEDHFSQARMYWNSLSDLERDDLLQTFAYHLGKVASAETRTRTVEMFCNVDRDLACALADEIGVDRPAGDHVDSDLTSPALSIMDTESSAATLRVGVLVGDGFDEHEVGPVLEAVEGADAVVHVVGGRLGTVTATGGATLTVDETVITGHPALYDALYVVGGTDLDQRRFDEAIAEFVRQAHRYLKPIAVAATGQGQAALPADADRAGVFGPGDEDIPERFVAALARHRVWERR